MSRIFDVLRKGCERGEDLILPGSGLLDAMDKGLDLKRVSVEEVSVDPRSRIAFCSDPHGPGADRIRFLRMRLRELWTSGKLKSLLITSPLPGDGKSTIALNLATALAEGGKRSLLLVEADLHHSSLRSQLKLGTSTGLAECLEDGIDPVSSVRRLEPLGWYLLSAGRARGNPTDLLQSEVLPRVMQDLSARFDWVLIDSPPIIPLTDAISLQRQANASLLVARADSTPQDAIEKAIKLIGREHVLGIVLNGVEGRHRLYSQYYGYYGGSNAVKRSL